MSNIRSPGRKTAFAVALLAATGMSSIATWQIEPAFAQSNAARSTDAQSDPAQTTAVHSAPIDVGQPAAAALPGFGDLVQKVSPAVVTITTTMQQATDAQELPFPPDSPRGRAFDQFFGQMPQGPAEIVHALGSGFIIDAQGHIVTNDHVVKNGSDIQVTLADGQKLPAKVVGVDPKTDLALLKVNADKPLPHLMLGNSAKARVGDWVVAVGNPFGLGGTVTAGILSARGRQIGEGPYDDFLQIDAPINRGNSGGPLFAQDGTVIGVNTAIYSPSGGSVGIGFAIPSSVVRQVVNQLEAHGRVERGWLGVSAQAVSPAMAMALHLSSHHGALVAQVQKDSPAATAGIKAGDVISQVGNQDVTDPHDLARIVAATQSGSQQDVTVRRDGQDKTIQVKVAELRDGSGTQQAAATEHHARLGLAVAPLNDQARQELDLPPDQKGVVVAGIRPGSPADNAGLQSGDVLESVGNQAVTTPDQAVTALLDGTAKAGSAVALRVLRNGQQAFVALSAPQADAG